MKFVITIFLGFILSLNLKAQSNDCINDFNFLIDKIKADYPGYNDKVKAENVSKLKTLENELRKKITKYPDSCSFYLMQYTSFFKDNHLRVGRNSQNNQRIEKSDTSSFGKNVPIKDFQNIITNPKSIEGLWISWGGKIAIIKSDIPNKYLGIVIEYSGWKANQVIYEFDLKSDTLFNLTIHSNYKNTKPNFGLASLHLDKKVIEIHGDSYFVRCSESEIIDNSILYTYKRAFPIGLNTFFVATILSDSTFYMRVPSFLGLKNLIDKTISYNWESITKRPNLIIDIRNNGGGQDIEYFELLKLIYTNPYESKGAEWFATKGNINYFENCLQKGEIRKGAEGWTKALISEMKKNIGGFVDNGNQSIKFDTVYKFPKNIGIIINENNASSAEQFLLCAKNSKKVLLFGNHSTAGVLDYSNAVTIDFPSGKYKLNYPMTRSKRLPENPIDNIGIKPDIIIPFPATKQLYDQLDIWVYFVKNYLELMNKK